MKLNLTTIPKTIGTLLLLLCCAAPMIAQNCISGTVFSDDNYNGIQDPGEAGLENFQVSLGSAEGFAAQTFTNAEGYYEFCDLEEGTYEIVIYAQLGGYYIANNALLVDFGGDPLPDNDFPLVPADSYGSFRGQVYVDINGDGERQVDEPGFLHTINVQRIGDPNAFPILSDSKGRFELLGLQEGEYQITSNPAPQGLDLIGEINQTIVVSNGMVVNDVDFLYGINEEFGLISDFVCIDWDGDGSVSPDDFAGIGMHNVELVDAQGGVRTALSCTNGQFAFIGVVPGAYTLRSTDPGYNLSPITPTEYAISVPAGGIERRAFYYEPIGNRIDCGEIVLNCFSGFVSNQPPNLDVNAPVLGIVDLTSLAGNTPGSNWGPPGAAKTMGPDWNANRMGQIFGLAIDNNQFIYTSASSIYGLFPAGTAGPGGVYRIDPVSLVVTDFITTTNVPGVYVGTNTIYNTGSGLGNIAYDAQNNQFFLTNFEDGLLYRVSNTGIIQETYDYPGTILHTGVAGFAPLGERLWGVGVLDNRVYFSVWNEDFGPSRLDATRNNEVWSIALDGSGAISGVPDLTLEVDMGTIGLGNSSSPISDISFDQAGNMAIGEKSMRYDHGTFHLEPAGPYPPGVGSGAGASHRGRVITFTNSGGTFTFDQHLLIGNFSIGHNSAGGIDYTHSYDADGIFLEEECDQYIWSTGDALRWGSYNNAPGLGGTDLLYGLAGVPVSGNSAVFGAPDWVKTTSYYVDMAAGNYAKAEFGDVEVYDCECPRETCAESGGLNMIPNSPNDPQGVGDCCAILDFSNTGPFDVYGINLSALDGVEFQAGYTIAGGYYTPNYTDTSMLIVPTALGTMPTNINGLINFCWQHVYATPQFLVIEYLDENYEVFCTDTLRFECPPEAPCLEYLSDSLVCDTMGYLYTVDFEVPPGSDIPGGIGYIELNLNPNNLPAGTIISPLGYTFSPKLQPGDQVTLTYNINSPVDLYGDSLCVVITAHDDEEERLCCFAYEACIPFPLCDPCPYVDAVAVPAEENQAEYCCFELLITDTFGLDPNLFTSIETNIITPGVVYDGLITFPAILDGWTPTYDNPAAPTAISWNHSSGVVPNNTNYNLFDFCVEGVTNTDSIFIAINWLNQDSVICTDTIGIYCPYCLTVVEDELFCDDNGDYVYQFSFVNNSPYNVNAVSLLDASGFPGTVGNPGVYMLGTSVPPGGTYSGTIPVQLNGAAGDEVCFDIVLRQIIGDAINITCCYATHCVELLPCSVLPQLPCPIEVVEELPCEDVYDPVCGCDGRTYANICYAENAGILNWTAGPCDPVINDDGLISLEAQLASGGVNLNWSVSDDPGNYDFFVIREAAEVNGYVYEEVALIPANGMASYNFLRTTTTSGSLIYQIVGITTTGGLIGSNEAEVFRPENMELTTIYAYPSPARDEVQVTVNRRGDANIELLSPQGQIQRQQAAQFNGAPVRVGLQDLNDGVFLIRVRFNDGEVVQRRIVRVRE